MVKRIWNHSFGKFDSDAFWKEFSSSFGTALGIGGLFVLPLLLVIIVLALR